MRALERRIMRLEGGAHIGGDVAKASAVMQAYEVVNYHADEATEADRAIVAALSREEWSRAFAVVVEAAGGLEVVVRKSMLIFSTGLEA